MIPRIFLVFMQILSALYFTPFIIRHIPIGKNDIIYDFLMAAIFAIIIWLIGHVGGIVLKEVKAPSAKTLTATMAGALIGATIIVLIPEIPQYIIQNTGITISNFSFPLAGALIGYFYQK